MPSLQRLFEGGVEGGSAGPLNGDDDALRACQNHQDPPQESDTSREQIRGSGVTWGAKVPCGIPLINFCLRQVKISVEFGQKTSGPVTLSSSTKANMSQATRPSTQTFDNQEVQGS